MEKTRILIADDDVALLTAMAIRLRAEGFDVITAPDGYSALAHAVDDDPDLILLDVNMPCGAGPAIQERLENIVHGTTVPIIYITGVKSQLVDELPDHAGVFAVLHKPFETEELLRVIHRALWSRAA